MCDISGLDCLGLVVSQQQPLPLTSCHARTGDTKISKQEAHCHPCNRRCAVASLAAIIACRIPIHTFSEPMVLRSPPGSQPGKNFLLDSFTSSYMNRLSVRAGAGSTQEILHGRGLCSLPLLLLSQGHLPFFQAKGSYLAMNGARD